MAIEIVDFPIKNGDFPSFFVCSPEGISISNAWWLGGFAGCFQRHIDEQKTGEPWDGSFLSYEWGDNVVHMCICVC